MKGNNFKMRTRSGTSDTGWVTEDYFVYEAVDADLYVEVDGEPVFSPGAYRVSGDGFLRSVPIIVFLEELVASCNRLSSEDPSTEKVSITSTQYFMEIERRDDKVNLRLQEERPDGVRKLAETRLTLAELQNECKSIARQTLLRIVTENRDLKGNPHLQRFESSIHVLEGR